MYNPSISSNSDILTAIEDVDIYNSSIIEKLSKAELRTAKINKINTNRLDLVCRKLYNDNPKYKVGILSVVNRFESDTDISKIQYIDQTEINKVIGY